MFIQRQDNVCSSRYNFDPAFQSDKGSVAVVCVLALQVLVEASPQEVFEAMVVDVEDSSWNPHVQKSQVIPLSWPSNDPPPPPPTRLLFPLSAT